MAAGDVSGQAEILALRALLDVAGEKIDAMKGAMQEARELLAARRDDAHARARRKADAALAKLLRTAPATLAGIRAAVEYFVEWDENCIPEDSGEYLITLARSPALAMAGEAG